MSEGIQCSEWDSSFSGQGPRSGQRSVINGGNGSDGARLVNAAGVRAADRIHPEVVRIVEIRNLQAEVPGSHLAK